MKKIIFYFVALLSLSVALISCSKDYDTGNNEREDKLFDTYLSSENISDKPTESGLVYIEEERGTGISPVVGDYVLINYSLYLVENSILVYSTNQKVADRAGIYDDRVLYGPNKFIVGTNLPGLDEGLQLMKAGGKATLLFRSDLGYGNETKGPIGPNSSLRMEVELIEVMNDPAKAEFEKTMKYLKNYGLSMDTTKQGIYFTKIEDGNSDVSLEFGDFVGIKITGKLLDGRVFYQSRDFQFTLGNTEKDVTYGLTFGLKMMSPGSSAVIVVPYQLGYGELGWRYNKGYVKTPIPPYSTLVYEVSMTKTPSLTGLVGK